MLFETGVVGVVAIDGTVKAMGGSGVGCAEVFEVEVELPHPASAMSNMHATTLAKWRLSMVKALSIFQFSSIRSPWPFSAS